MTLYTYKRIFLNGGCWQLESHREDYQLVKDLLDDKEELDKNYKWAWIEEINEIGSHKILDFRFGGEERVMKRTKGPIGHVTFDGVMIDVYENLDEPLFKTEDVYNMLEPGIDFEEFMALAEDDETINCAYRDDAEDRYTVFFTEQGLYSVLAQIKTTTARKWRRLIVETLVELRKSRNMNILQQFDEWDHRLDDLYFDEETGKLMMSVTVQGGDVEQVPYDFDEDLLELSNLKWTKF